MLILVFERLCRVSFRECDAAPAYRDLMPTSPALASEAAIEVLRGYPPLAVDLVRAKTLVRLPPKIATVLEPSELTEALPDDLRAHTTVVVTDAVTREAALAVLLEPEGRDEETMEYLWPCYVAAALAVLQCPVFLLVICPDPAEAARCQRIIRTGHPGFDLIPLIIDHTTFGNLLPAA